MRNNENVTQWRALRFNELVGGSVSAGAEGRAWIWQGRGWEGLIVKLVKMRTPKLAVANLTRFLFLGNVRKRSHRNVVILVKN
jgi:hypothetical protein